MLQKQLRVWLESIQGTKGCLNRDDKNIQTCWKKLNLKLLGWVLGRVHGYGTRYEICSKAIPHVYDGYNIKVIPSRFLIKNPSPDHLYIYLST